MTESNPTEHNAPTQHGTGQAARLEEVAQDGPLPETDSIDEVAEAGRDHSEVDDPGDNKDTDPIAGAGILGHIAQSR